MMTVGYAELQSECGIIVRDGGRGRWWCVIVREEGDLCVQVKDASVID
jgi:hypothetical protein